MYSKYSVEEVTDGKWELWHYYTPTLYTVVLKMNEEQVEGIKNAFGKV
jgi:hypothetical protein